MKISNAEWKKRLTAGMLAIAMLCGVMPTAVMAEDTTSQSEAIDTLLIGDKTITDEKQVLLEEESEEEAEKKQEEEQEEEQEKEQEKEQEEEQEEEQELLPMPLTDDPAVDGEDLPATQEGEPTPLPIPTTPTLTLEASGLSPGADNKITITSTDDLIKLSNVDPKEYYDKTIQLSMTEGESWKLGVDTSDGYTFLGLGGAGQDGVIYPFSGQLLNTAEGYWILTTHPLFNNLSTEATLATLQMGSHSSTSQEDPPITSTAPLLAGTVSGTATGEWSVKLVGDSSFGGLIGTLESGSVNLTISGGASGDASLTCSSDAHTGLFCNTMRAGTTLTATNSAANITVKSTAEGCDAGGFVGRMENGATLTASGNSVASVTSEQGNAGGIVGSAVNATITVSGTGSGNITVSASKNAGGIVGDYVNSKPNAGLDLSNYTTSVTISGGSNAGGVFGALTNNTGAENAASVYTIQDTIQGGTITATVSGSGSVTNFGGLIGYYSADAMGNTLSISNVTVSSTNSGSATSYGGVIGSVGDNSYVEIENLETVTTNGNAGTNFGGLVGVLGDNSAGDTSGAFLNIGNVALDGGVTLPPGANAVGGLVGALTAGVVRLHGTTNLRGMSFAGAGGGTGQIVGKNTNGLVYAVGTGNAIGENDSGWLLKRPTGATASDIGNWGQVVRLDGERLTEKNDNNTAPNTDLFAFNETNHTVTVLGGDSTITRITSARDFASYALHYDFGCADQAALIFEGSGVAPNEPQTVTISGKIDLTGTGILGIGRDNGTGANGTGNADSNYFTGTISGTGDTPPTIVLDIGCSAFGDGVDKSADPIGNGGLQLFSDGHNYLGLLPVAGGSTTIRNLTIAGAVMGNSGSSAKGRVAGAIGYCKADEITFNNVTVSADVTVKGSSSTIYQGGFFGDMVNGNNKSVTFQGSTWSGTLDNSVSGSQIGGFAAYIQNGKKTITVADCTLSGTIKTSADGDAHVGGLFADFQDGGGNTTVTISDLKVTGTMKVEAPKATSCGGFLGYSWPKTNVTFAGTGASGITVSGATLNAPKARFGGLVYQASGYWNATAANSIKFTSATAEDGTVTKTQISGKSDASNPSGLLVGTGLLGQNNALYLEVGTWRKPDAADSDVFAYDIGAGAVQLNLGTSTTFDELVGVTIDDNKGHNNAVVSLATPGHAEIDNTACNTYTGQIKNFQNGKTRYYYNLDSYRSGVAANNLRTPGAVLCWSVSQYAAGNIKGYFCSGDAATISSDIDLTGYSYYPVSPLNSVSITGANLTFAYEEMNGKENGNKPFDDSNYQHYMMHYGLLYDVSNSVSVSGSSSFSGTVGMDTEGSGALIFGTVTGNTDKPVEISLSGVTLNNLRVSGVEEDTQYAPLLINKNTNGGMKLTVDELGTTGYAPEAVAATSLIGRIGSDTATKLTLEFKNIALDGRKSAVGKPVSNNGEYPVDYGTTKTIFTHATLLESFQYLSDSTGVYNFNSDDNNVTYGYEISDSQRNPGEQYMYYDTDDLVWDGVTGNDNPTEEEIKEYYTDYLPYVAISEKKDGNYHELDVNLRLVHLDVGCGTYGHPYEITDGKQLEILANYLATGRASNWVVCVNTVVYGEKCGTAAHNPGDDHYYLCDGETWFDAQVDEGGKYHKKGNTASEAVNKAGMYAYLRNAYYQINEDITISSSTYMGIGGNVTSGDGANAFSGTIMGKSDTKPTVYISSQITGAQSFGGLVRYSQGSVIKNLTVSYAGKNVEGEDPIDPASIGMTNSAVPGTYDDSNKTQNNPFFGGVVGYCMGGDTIIDNVSVEYGQNSVALSGTNGTDRLIAAGGYVGLVGGAKNKDGFEKTGGGVVFRNMGSHSNNFANTLSNAGEESPTWIPDDKSYALSEAQLGCTYFFCNPYVGRVLDGYACAIGCTVNNTDKNYKIPNLDIKNTGLSVSGTDVTVSSAQGLWLLSAIVNSGAGAMDSTGTYREVDSKLVDAYQYGKPRSGEPSDETYWGGVASKSGIENGRVSFLVKEFTSGTDAAHLTGKSTSDTNNPVALTFNKDINMTSYGNGFRGIGASYTVSTNLWNKNNQISLPKNYRRALLVSGINTEATSETPATTITLKMSQREYHPGGQVTDYEKGFWNQGAGLFTAFSYTSDAQVKNLTLSGTVCLNTFDPTNGRLSRVMKKNYDFCVGGFAGLISNSSGTVSFTDLSLDHLNVYGGTTTGGVFGITSKSSLAFPSFTVSYVDVIKTVTTDGSIGGLVGLKMGDVTIGTPKTIPNAKISTVNDLTVQMFGTKTTSQDCGGLIGCSDGGNLTIQNIQATNLMVHGEDTRDVGGLVSGFREGGTLTISDCKLTNLKIIYEATTDHNKDNDACRNAGGVVGFVNQNVGGIKNVQIVNANMSSTKGSGLGGFVGNANKGMTMDSCHISGSLYMSGINRPYLGGMVGWLTTGETVTIKNSTETNLNILSGDHDAGGLVGQMKNGKTDVSNVSFSNVKVVTTVSGKSVGLLTGHTNGKPLNAYNILADSCTVGCVADNATIDSLGSINSTGTYIGLWLGGSKGQENKLVAVAATDTNRPQKDVGFIENGKVHVIHADYPVDQGNKPETDSASPWLDVNPSETLAGKTYTGNGVGYLDGGNTTLQNSIPYRILSEAKTDGHYYNVKDSAVFTFSDIVSTDNNNVNSQKNIRLRTFAEYLELEEKQTLTDELRTSGNFPLLVVDNLGGSWVTEAIWNYIAALTNVSSGAEAKNQTASVTPTTYYWDAETLQFKKETKSPTMTVSGKGFFCSSNAYDNGKMQFTLLDVKYANPTDDKHTGFHLYVPVLVKKIMDAKVNVSILAGTSYLSDDYDANTARYATAGFDEPVTAYITYNYSRSKEEWQSALNDGSNLLWYYEKTLNLTNGITPLPTGTKLTLVNAQSGQMYYHEIQSNEVDKPVQTAYKLEEHFVNSSGQWFVSSPICDMLNISADPVKDGDKPANHYVVAESKDKATVKVDGTYYRLYNTETDEDVEDIFCLTVGDGVVGNEGDYLSTPEGYYLTIQIPKMDKAVNNTLFIENEQSLTKSEYALPVRVKDNLSDGDDARHYVIYDGLNTPTIFTKIQHYNKNGEKVDSPEMQNGDSIEVQLESEISLTADGVSYYKQGYAPAELYHQFLLSMRKKDENDAVSAILIGAEDIQWTYTIDGKTIGSGTEHPRDLDVLTLKFGTKETHLIEKLRDSEGHSVTVGATITLRYGNNVSAVFPERAADDSKSGLYVHTESRVAADSNLLPTTGVKAKKDETDGFFCSSPSNATMSYDAIEKYGTDGKTLQLGINPLDRYSVGIRAEGIYDYSAVSETTLGKADTIRYTLELFQKGENGEYVQVSGEKISSYLPVPKLITNITGSTGEEQTFTLEGDSYQLEHDFTRADSGNEIIVMDLEPKTGSELEEASGFYANYRVRWTAVMLDGTDELSDTLASDYIVYTNAKILQKLVSSSEQNENT